MSIELHPRAMAMRGRAYKELGETEKFTNSRVDCIGRYEHKTWNKTNLFLNP